MGVLEEIQAQQLAKGTPTTPGTAPNSLFANFGPESARGSAAPGPGAFTTPTTGYGILPRNAGSLAEGIYSMGSASLPTPGQASDIPSYRARLEAAQAAKARGGMLEGYEQTGLEQQSQQQIIKTKLLQQLLEMFQGGPSGPGRFSLRTPTAVSPDPRLLAAIQAQIQQEFDRPGGLQSRLQQLGASQNRYSADSLTAVARQAALDRARGGAMAESYIPALAGTVQAMQPGLEQERIAAQTELTPARLLSLLLT